jgi:4-hydroxy-tetrahydrodipicolinate reductase
MARTLKVAVAGLGPVGQSVARAVLQTPALKLVAAADPAPLHAGKDLGTVLGLPRKLKVKVEGKPERFFQKVRADVAFVCTSSLLKDVKPQIAALVARRVNVLTTCEELAWPVPPRAAAFRELDRLAKRKKVSVLATGVNPGFAMDALALALTAPCARVRRVSVTRVVDAAARKLCSPAADGRRLASPVPPRGDRQRAPRGPRESAHGAAALGWSSTMDRRSATIAPRPRRGPPHPGRDPPVSARRAYRAGELAISLDLQVYVGPSPRDHVSWTATAGRRHDRRQRERLATAAAKLNSCPSARPGRRLFVRPAARPR